MHRPGCKYLYRGDFCYAGCTSRKLARHFFYKAGNCKYGDRCRKSHLPNNTRPRPPPRAPDPEPYDGAREDLKLLGLNCDGENVSRGLIDEARKRRILETHPDKHRNEYRDAYWTDRYLKVVAAAERLLACRAFPDRCG